MNRKKADAGEKGLVDSNKLDGPLHNTHKKSFQADDKCLQDGVAEARATSVPILLTIDPKQDILRIPGYIRRYACRTVPKS